MDKGWGSYFNTYFRLEKVRFLRRVGKGVRMEPEGLEAPTRAKIRATLPLFLEKIIKGGGGLSARQTKQVKAPSNNLHLILLLPFCPAFSSN